MKPLLNIRHWWRIEKLW